MTPEDIRDGFEMFYGIGHEHGAADTAPAAAAVNTIPVPAVTLDGATVTCTPAVAAAPPASREEWLQQVSQLEAQLQATLALGPAGAAAVRVAPPPAVASDTSVACQGDAGDDEKERPRIEMYSVSTPSAPPPSQAVSCMPGVDPGKVIP